MMPAFGVKEKLPEFTKKYKEEAQHSLVDFRVVAFPLLMHR
jgi:hypothetical protein